MPLNHRQLTQRAQETGRAYRNYRNLRDVYGQWSRDPSFPSVRDSHVKKHRDYARKFLTVQQRIVRLVQILQAQKRRQYLKQTARARKVRKEKLWLKRHGHMMFGQPKYGRGKGRGASMAAVRASDPEWVKYAKAHNLPL